MLCLISVRLSWLAASCEAVCSAGGDWGQMVVFMLGVRHPDSCKGIHTNFPFGSPKLSWPWSLLQWANASLLKKVPACHAAVACMLDSAADHLLCAGACVPECR